MLGLSPPAAKKLLGAKCIIEKDMIDMSSNIKEMYDIFFIISDNIRDYITRYPNTLIRE